MIQLFCGINIKLLDPCWVRAMALSFNIQHRQTTDKSLVHLSYASDRDESGRYALGTCLFDPNITREGFARA